MADNILNARIKLKYDTLDNWNSSTFIPLAGEVCIAYLPTTGNIAGNSDTQQANTPKAVCIKVGDGVKPFSQLPWIQAVAADVYGWAKASTKPNYNASEIAATARNGNTNASNVQAILTALQNTVATLTGSEGAQSIEGQIASAIEDLDGVITGTPGTSKTLTIFTQADGVVTATFDDIQIAESQVTSASGGWITNGLAAKAPLASPNLTGTPTAPTAAANSNSTQIATTAFVKNAVDTATAGLAGAMHFIGITSTALTDGATTSTLTPKTTGSLSKTTSFEGGDVVLYDNGTTIGKEFVWTGSAWELLGDEGSYAVKGSITNDDIANSAAIAQTKIAGSTANTTLSDDLSLLAPKVSPTFTGTVTVPITPTYNTDAASKKYVDDKATASNTTYTFAEGDANGQIKITSSTNGVAGTPVNVKPRNLHKVATSGSIYDVEEINTSRSTASDGQKFFILDCGDATHFIDNASTT